MGNAVALLCATCEEALAAAASLPTERAIWCLAYAASRVLAQRKRRLGDVTNVNSKDRKAVLEALRSFCRGAARPTGPPGVVLQDSGTSGEPKPGDEPETKPKPEEPAKDERKTTALPAKPCENEDYIAVILVDTEPWKSRRSGKEQDWSVSEMRAYRDAYNHFIEKVKSLKHDKDTAHKKKGDPVYKAENVVVRLGIFLTGKPREETMNTTLNYELYWWGRDPCVRLVAFFGHGSGGEFEWPGGLTISSKHLAGRAGAFAKKTLGEFGHRLTTLFWGGCKGAETDEGTPEEQQQPHDDVAEQVHASSTDISPADLLEQVDGFELRTPTNPPPAR